MKKSERLIYLLEFLNQQEKVSLEEISGRCKISERTVYRDLKSLSELGFPVQFDDGYKLSKLPNGSVFNRFTNGELRLVSFALKTHPLSKLLPFIKIADKLTEIESSALEPANSQNIFLLEDSGKSNSHETAKNIVSSFIQAFEEMKQIRIRTKDSAVLTDYLPAAIRIKESDVILVVSTLDRSGFRELPLDKVSQIEITSKEFKRQPFENSRTENIGIG